MSERLLLLLCFCVECIGVYRMMREIIIIMFFVLNV